MVQKRGLVILLFLSLLLSGCYTITVSQTIEPDGFSSVSMIVNISSIIEQIPDNETESVEVTTMNYSSGCEDYANNTKLACTELDEGVIQLESTFEVPLIKTESLQETRYSYDALYIFEILVQMSHNPDEQITQTNLAQIKMLNPEYTYLIKMPGTITSTEVGDIFDNTVFIDIFDLESVPSAMITSVEEKELPWQLIGMIAGGIFLAFLLFGLIILGATHKSHPKTDANELACKTYVEQYKNMYSAEQLKQGLIASGHDPVKAAEYVQKYY